MSAYGNSMSYFEWSLLAVTSTGLNRQMLIQEIYQYSVGYANTSLLFETYLDAVSNECAKLTEPKWIKILGGVDVWTKDHCYEIVMAHRLD